LSVRFPFSAPVRPFYPFISCSSGSIGPFYPLASRFRVPLLRFARLLLVFGFRCSVLPVYFSLSGSVEPFYPLTSRFRILLFRFIRLLLAFGFCCSVLFVYFSLSNPLGCFTCLPLGLFSLFRRPPEFIGYALLREHIFPVFIKEKSGRE